MISNMIQITVRLIKYRGSGWGELVIIIVLFFLASPNICCVFLGEFDQNIRDMIGYPIVEGLDLDEEEYKISSTIELEDDNKMESSALKENDNVQSNPALTSNLSFNTSQPLVNDDLRLPEQILESVNSVDTSSVTLQEPSDTCIPKLALEAELIVRTDEPVVPLISEAEYDDRNESPDKEEKIKEISESLEQSVRNLSFETTEQITDDSDSQVGQSTVMQILDEERKDIENDILNSIEKSQEGNLDKSQNKFMEVQLIKEPISLCGESETNKEEKVNVDEVGNIETINNTFKSVLPKLEMTQNSCKEGTEDKKKEIPTKTKIEPKHNDKMNKSENERSKQKLVCVTAPLDPDEQFCDLFLAVKMEVTSHQCSVLVFNGVSTKHHFQLSRESKYISLIIDSLSALHITKRILILFHIAI